MLPEAGLLTAIAREIEASGEPPTKSELQAIEMVAARKGREYAEEHALLIRAEARWADSL